KTITVPVQVTATTNTANRLSAGGNHTLLVKEDGTAWAWGLNDNSQLGDGTKQNRTTPVESMLVITVQQLASAPSTVLLPTAQSKSLQITATYANGSTQDVTSQSTYQSSDPTIATVDAAGVISGKAAGNGTITVTYYDKTITVPVQVTATTNTANRLSAGGNHTLLVKEDGTAWAWGLNDNSQIGDGTKQNRTTPVESMLVITVQQLSSAPSSVLLPTAQSKSLQITATYANGSTQDVTSQSTYQSSDPTVATVDAAGVISGVAAGNATITVTYYDKTITVPVQVTATTNTANRLSAGGNHTLLVKEDGTAWAWGLNDNSQLGDGTKQNRTTPVESMLVITVQQLASAPSTVLLPTAQSKSLQITATYANGSTQDVTSQSTYQSSDPTIATVNAAGVISGVAAGNATITVSYYGKTITVPVQVTATTSTANRLSAGGNHTLLVKEDGTAWAWGLNDNSQLGDGTKQNRTTPVESMLVITVQQLASAPSTVLLPIAQSKNLQITATYANGSTQDVTSQSTYQSSDPTIATVNAAGVISGIAAGNATITVSYYGKTISVPVQVTATTSTANRLSAGGNHTLLVKEDGTAWAWGLNDNSQLGDGTKQNRTTPVESMLVITVQQLASVPSTVLLPTAQSKSLQITATYANGSTQDVTSQSTYQSSDPTIATVNAAGVISGVVAGNATITVSYYGKTISVLVQVTTVENKAIRLSAGGNHTLLVKEDGTAWAWGLNDNSQLGDGTKQNRTTPVESMLVITVQQLASAPSTVLLPSAQSKNLQITATYANGSSQDVTSQSTYQSSDPTIATINAAGVISGIAAGSATVTVSYYGKTITVPVQVTATTSTANRL
ncbi:Ig-like domain-containing protein, partial [Frankia sp. Cpl3]|nr:Ig-like domain-containing protein [Frankia sp. Cpl3]